MTPLVLIGPSGPGHGLGGLADRPERPGGAPPPAGGGRGGGACPAPPAPRPRRLRLGSARQVRVGAAASRSWARAQGAWGPDARCVRTRRGRFCSLGSEAAGSRPVSVEGRPRGLAGRPQPPGGAAPSSDAQRLRRPEGPRSSWAGWLSTFLCSALSCWPRNLFIRVLGKLHLVFPFLEPCVLETLTDLILSVMHTNACVQRCGYLCLETETKPLQVTSVF